jgi:hypothetical protein
LTSHGAVGRAEGCAVGTALLVIAAVLFIAAIVVFVAAAAVS